MWWWWCVVVRDTLAWCASKTHQRDTCLCRPHVTDAQQKFCLPKEIFTKKSPLRKQHSLNTMHAHPLVVNQSSRPRSRPHHGGQLKDARRMSSTRPRQNHTILVTRPVPHSHHTNSPHERDLPKARGLRTLVGNGVVLASGA